MPTSKAKFNDYVTRSFRDTADADYVAARALYRIRLDQQFLWAALQAIEKYLKAILLYHRVSTKLLGHDIWRALQQVREINPAIALDVSRDVEKFVQQLAVYGCNRYFEHPVNTEWIGLPMLDKAVWQIRKHCRAHSPKRNDDVLHGRLEEILSSNSRTRDDLVWKNIWFGHYKKTKFSRRMIWANPSNFIYPEIFPELDKLIHFSKPVRDYFLRRSERNDAAQRRVNRLTGVKYTMPVASHRRGPRPEEARRLQKPSRRGSRGRSD